MAKRRKSVSKSPAGKAAHRTKRPSPLANVLSNVSRAPDLGSATMTMTQDQIPELLRLTLKSALKSDTLPSPPSTGERHAHFDSDNAQQTSTPSPEITGKSSRNAKSTRLNTPTFEPPFSYQPEQLEDDSPVYFETGQSIEQLKAVILHRPQPLQLQQISNLLIYVQHELSVLAAAHFSFDLTPDQAATFPLGMLDVLHPELHRATQYIADGSQPGWLNFFTSAQSRPHLMHALIGEVITHHIFNNTCFGVNETELEQLERLDVLYLNWEGFVRTKERAKLLQKILSTKCTEEFQTDLNAAVSTLTNALLNLLAPLLPGYYGLDINNIEAGAIRTKLNALLTVATSLHLSIRLTGYNGTILSYQPHAKGSYFSLSTSSSRCVNRSSLLADASTAGAEDRVRLKMSCFPRVTAFVPFGPDLLEYKRLQLAKDGKYKKKGGDEFEDGPFYVDASIVDALATSAPILPSSLQDERTRDIISKRGDPAKPIEVSFPLRGSYVLISRLNRPDVYCEWTPPTDKISSDEEQAEGKLLGLNDAIHFARTGHLPKSKTKTPSSDKNEGQLQWRKDILPLTAWVLGGALLAALAVGVCRGDMKPAVFVGETVENFKRVLGGTRGAVGVARRVVRRAVGVEKARGRAVKGRAHDFRGNETR